MNGIEISTQLRAQQATTATLSHSAGTLRAGTRVSLSWETSSRRRLDGRLYHLYTAFGYDPLGNYVMEYVTADSLDSIEFSTGTK